MKRSGTVSRRDFLSRTAATGLAIAASGGLSSFDSAAAGMQFGFVTYQWGRDWDLPTLISNCQKTGLLAVELRTGHAHKVESNLSDVQRKEVKQKFADSGVTCLGYGSNFEYHSPDAAELRTNIEQTKIYLQLCKDIGASGIKIKPNDLPATVPRERTIAQIAASFNEVGKFAQDLGQRVRVEVHGHLTQEIPNIKAIFEQVTAPNVKMCWNCNPEDLLPPGLEMNFNSVKKWFGDTVHVRELNLGDYPYQQLMNLFAGMDYKGWILLEARTEPADRVGAMKEQREVFDQMVASAKRK